MMLEKLRSSNPFQAPYIKVNVKVAYPGITNGKPNIREEEKYVLAPSAKKIGTYIRNQLFGSDLLTQTEGLNINWLMPTLSEATELAVYEKESFIYIHKFDGKVYLECIKKCDIHNLVQKYDKVYSCDLIQDFEGIEFDYSLKRHIEIKDGNSIIKFTAYRKEKDRSDWQDIPLSVFNEANKTNYKELYDLPYEVLINIDTGQDFFKDSEKFLLEEMEVYNTLCEEVQKTKTRIATTQHYQSGDIYNQWQPSNMYDVKTINVGGIQDFFTLLPGDREHAFFEFLQGNLRVNDYIDTFITSNMIQINSTVDLRVSRYEQTQVRTQEEQAYIEDEKKKRQQFIAAVAALLVIVNVGKALIWELTEPKDTKEKSSFQEGKESIMDQIGDMFIDYDDDFSLGGK